MTEFFNAHPTYLYLLPEIMIVAVAMIVFVADLFVSEKHKHILGVIAVIGMGLVFIPLMGPRASEIPAGVNVMASSMIKHDAFARIFNIIFLVSSIIAILLSMRYEALKKHVGEFYVFLALATNSFFFVSSAVNFLMIYVGIEFVAICCYILAAYLKDEPKSLEGGIKYLLLGAIASAFLLFSISLLFGLTGSLDIVEVSNALRNTAAPNYNIILIAFVFMIASFGFKIAMFPFHTWCPEAYEGAPTPITAFLSVTPKAAGLSVLLRVLITVFHDVPIPWVDIIQWIAILTMTLGNVVALWQTNIKRLMAYSSIAHVGYLLIGLVVAGACGINTQLGKDGLLAAELYIVSYLFMNLGAFGVIITVSNFYGGTDYDIARYHGLGRRNPLMAGALAVFLLSLAGIPPTIGFIGKFFLFKAAVQGGFNLLSGCLVVNSVISIYYYWNIARLMFMEDPDLPQPVHAPALLWGVTIAMLVCVLGFGIFFQELMVLFQNSLLTI